MPDHMNIKPHTGPRRTINVHIQFLISFKPPQMASIFKVEILRDHHDVLIKRGECKQADNK